MPNPLLPLNEYIPDAEMHVFGERVYLYGSHDAANSTRFCIQDYTVYSADIHDLSKWTCHGVTYRKDQDPHSTNGKPVDFYAPDCVRGNDGKYYLYYCAMGPNTRNFGPISVAVSEKPEGPFAYLGDVHYPSGEVMLKYMNNDPTVLNDDGRIYLYYGWGLGRDFSSKLLKPIYDRVLAKIAMRSVKEVKETKPSILSCAFVELENDMLTVKEGPKAVLDSKTTADRNSELYHHPFYEAPSIRKFNGIYYLIYSSGVNNELAYATSRYPDRDFQYRGVLISNSNLGYRNNTSPENNSGTIHGSVELINGEYYVIYHRATNNTDFSRQACMEKITMKEDGTFVMAEMTTSGIDTNWKVRGEYSAAICCSLKTTKPIHLGVGKQQSLPRITEREGKLILADLTSGCKISYRYLDLTECHGIRLKIKGDATVCLNGREPDSDGVYFIEPKNHASVTLDVVTGHCDIETIEFI